MATILICIFTALVSTHAVCMTLFVPRILFQVPSTSGTINRRSNLFCAGVVIKGQETQFTLIAVSVFIP